LENIMNFSPRQNEFGLSARLLVAVLAIALLPMSSGAAPGIAANEASPQIVNTSPQIGATGVNPSLSEITVTFDRDMGKGMSWTGEPPQFPPIDQSRKPMWKDRRTCALPVKLEKASFYRLGINSSMHQNFRSADGTPALPAAIFFTTQGASDEVQAQAKAPEVKSLEPNNGAMNVDPKTTELKVTFNMPMNSGMSWTGGGPSFPKLAEGKKPSWSADGLTCTLPVVLEPGHDYQLGLNSVSHKNFQSKAGVPLEPVTYRFRTAGAQ
jgi:RNA polymerase sigma-70 factor (ECF subfamily)